MEEQNYQKQMRAYIELVKKMSFEAPLQQTLTDLKTMAKGTQDLADRIEVRVKQSLEQDKRATKKGDTKKASIKKPSVKPFPSVKQMPKQKPVQAPNNNNPLPTSNTPTATAFTQGDINRVGNMSLQPIKPQPPIGSSD